MKDQKPRIGRPPLYEEGSEPVTARLSVNDIKKLIEEFGTAGAGVQKAVKNLIRTLGKKEKKQ